MFCTTASGVCWNLTDPKHEDVDIGDIAHALSMQCRFNGHVREFYSVAEHSYRISMELAAEGHDAEVQMFGLLHDAAEAYIGDVIKPLKPLVKGFKEIEIRTMQVILEALGLDFVTPKMAKIVHEMDVRMLMTEARDLMDRRWFEASGLNNEPQCPPLHDRILVTMQPTEAMQLFLERYYRLSEQL